jgi:hypothetical protein
MLVHEGLRCEACCCSLLLHVQRASEMPRRMARTAGEYRRGMVWWGCVARDVWRLLCCRLGEDVKPGLRGNRPLIEASGVIEP